jgi:2-phospho-L-lactate/phosphoenolpyruvate guanylyltransferase
MSLWTIIPIRGLAAGKTRLAGVLDARARTALTTQMFERTMQAVQDAHGTHAHTLVACARLDAFALACSHGAQARLDSEGAGLNRALADACAHARDLGASRVMVIAADMPAISAPALQRFAQAAGSAGTALLADKFARGTNGMIVSCLDDPQFAFGTDSLERHRRRFAARGPVTIINDPELAFDVDTADDYRALTAGAAST